jgi:hypothetical protein
VVAPKAIAAVMAAASVAEVILDFIYVAPLSMLVNGNVG